MTFKRNQAARPLLWCGFLLACFCAIGMWIASFAAEGRKKSQMQTDPSVATAWMVGVTRSSGIPLVRGTHLQKWLNEHSIKFLGEYREFRTRYTNDADGLEFWFDYESHVPGHPLLECHRIGRTAFVDDMGQPYHGFLDFQGKSIGIYLPGYDHAARRLTCTIHWMPRRPDLPSPISLPMVFKLDLPPAPRLLPAFSDLPRGPISQSIQGVTVIADAARLSAPLLGTSNLGQRNLTFRLKVLGGQLANSNVFQGGPISSPISPLILRSFGPGVPFSMRGGPSGQATLFNGRRNARPFFPTVSRPLTITDPYGISLISGGEVLSPLSPDDTSYRQGNDVMTWTVPVNGGGHGTNVTRLQCDVMPTGAASSNSAVHFDLILPVQTGDEI